jgi:hypothetical protein
MVVEVPKQEDGIRIIKIPKPASLVERQQALLEAIGVSTDQFKVLDIQHDAKSGVSYVIAEMSPEMAAATDKRAATRLYDPEKATADPSIRVKDTEFEILSRDGLTETQAKAWVVAERKKRAKPKRTSGHDVS